MAVASTGLHAVSPAALEAAQVALERTPEQLAVLARAGVVDAGGAGLVLVLECLERSPPGRRGRVVLGVVPSRPPGPVPSRRRSRARGPAARCRRAPTRGAAGPEYEVMYLLAVEDEDRIPCCGAASSSWATRSSSSVATASGTSTPTWTTRARPSRPASRLAAPTGSASPDSSPTTVAPCHVRTTARWHGAHPMVHPAPDAAMRAPGDRRSSRAPPATGSRPSSTRPVPSVVPSGPGHRASTGAAHRRHPAAARDRGPGRRRAAQRRRHGARSRGRGPRGRRRGHRGPRRAGPDRRPGTWPPSRCSSPTRCRPSNMLAMQSAVVGDPARRRHDRQPGRPDERRARASRGTCSASSTATSSSSAPTSSSWLGRSLHRLLSSGGELVTLVVGESAPGRPGRGPRGRGVAPTHRGVEVTHDRRRTAGLHALDRGGVGRGPCSPRTRR